MKPAERPRPHMQGFLMQLQIIQRICIHRTSLNMAGVRKAVVCLQRTLEQTRKKEKMGKASYSVGENIPQPDVYFRHCTSGTSSSTFPKNLRAHRNSSVRLCLIPGLSVLTCAFKISFQIRRGLDWRRCSQGRSSGCPLRWAEAFIPGGHVLATLKCDVEEVVPTFFFASTLH